MHSINYLRLKDGITPESLMVQGDSSDNNWQKEIWYSTLGDIIVYDKHKTIKNCWEKHKVTSIADTGYRIELPEGAIAPNTPSPEVELKVPLVVELKSFSAGLLCDTNLWRNIKGDNSYYKHINAISGFSEALFRNVVSVKDMSNEDLLDKHRLAIWRRNLPNNKFNSQFLDAVKEYFYKIPIMFEVNNLFGCPDNFSAHWNWSGAIQQLWSNNNKPWKFYFMSPLPKEYNYNGISAIAMLANTNMENIEFYYDGSVKISNMESMFSNIRTGNWGSFNVSVKKVKPINWNGEASVYPNVVESTDREPTDFYLFEPTNVIKTFRNCQITQASLDNIMDHTSWRNCNSFVGCFHSGLRTRHSYIKPAAGCEKFQDSIHNVWMVSKMNNSDKNFGQREYINHEGTKFDIGSKGGLFECFTDSSIEEVGAIIDLTYVYENQDFTNTFNAWRETDGCRFMKRVRIRGLGNLPFYDFNYEHGQGNNGKHFDRESVEYIFNYGLRNLRHFEDTQEAKNRTLLLRGSSILYCPAEWEQWITEEMINSAKAKGWSIYINNIEK